MPSLSTVFDSLETRWPCTPKEYPVLANLTDPTHIFAFKLHHALAHVHKTVGKLEAMVERLDHGASPAELDQEQLVELTGKLLLDGYQVAKTFGVKPERLETWLADFLQ